jgi:glyoxylase-like metal-dependent hydrolase (beta-lactamase superfamily II)
MKSKTLISLLLVSVLGWAGSSSASNFTQDNVQKSQDIIEQTLQAYGGAEKLQGLNQLIVDYDVSNVAGGQSRKPEPPWDTSKGDRVTAFDFVNRTTVTKFSGDGAGGRFSGTNIVNGEQSANLDHILKTRAKVTAVDFDTAAGPSLRSNGTLLLKRLQQYSGSARYLGETQLDNRKHYLLSFSMPGGPAITLYIDQKTHLISKSERVVGVFLVEYFFSDHKLIDGLLLPFENSYTVNGVPSQTFSAESYKINSPLDKLLAIPNDYQQIAAAPPQDMKTNVMGDGVFWVTQNGQNSLFVEFDDHLMMIGGLPGVTQRIAEIRKTVPDKPVKYTVMTHHHSDHIGGSQEVNDAGITFITVKEHQQVISNAVAEKDRPKAKFELLKDHKVYADKSQRVEIYDIGPTPHTEHFLLAYLPKQNIIFEADHFGVSATGPMPYRNPNIASLVESIKKRDLNVKHITSAHGNRVTTFSQLMESYNKTL